MSPRPSLIWKSCAHGLFPAASVVIFLLLACPASADYTPLTWHKLGNGTEYWVRALTVWNGNIVAGGDFNYDPQGNLIRGGVSLWDGLSWVPLGDEDAYVEPNALTVWDGKLFAGGFLLGPVGGPQSWQYGVYSWDGSNWIPVGTDYDDVVRALTVWNGGLVAAGDFTSIAAIPANNIAFWNGYAWSPLGEGTNGSINSLTVWDGKLVASGTFTSAGGIEAHGLALWDGSHWSALSTYMNSSLIGAMTVLDGKLIAAGVYYPSDDFDEYILYVASWDGSAWTPLGAIPDGDVWDLAVWNGGIVAGGRFMFSWNGEANNIVFWNGSRWSALGEGMDNWVDAFTVWNGSLVAGGRFHYAGQALAHHVALYDNLDISNGHWSPLGSGVNTSCYGVEALTNWNNRLVAGGVFTSAGGVPVKYVAAWDGSRWSALGSGTSSPVWALTSWNGKLVAGGDFYSAGGIFVNHVAVWDGSGWSALGSGVNDTVNALTVWNGKLVVGGCFTSAGGVNVSNVALWDGSTWSPLGSGMKDCVDSLAVWNGSLVADGTFHTEDSFLYHATVWNGSEWSILGEQSAGPAITVWNGSLVAGSDMRTFTVADSNPYGYARGYYVAVWNGSAWFPLGARPDDTILINWNGSVLPSGLESEPDALTVWNNSLVAGGGFMPDWATLTAGYVDVWNGSSWSALGTGMNNDVKSLNVWNGRLYAGGYFDYADYFTVNNIAFWNVSAQTDTTTCTLPGNSPPCDTVTLSEVVAAINEWSGGGLMLNAVVSLINSWASPESYPPE